MRQRLSKADSHTCQLTCQELRIRSVCYFPLLHYGIYVTINIYKLIYCANAFEQITAVAITRCYALAVVHVKYRQNAEENVSLTWKLFIAGFFIDVTSADDPAQWCSIPAGNLTQATARVHPHRRRRCLLRWR